jgi:hypothetical protein
MSVAPATLILAASLSSLGSASTGVGSRRAYLHTRAAGDTILLSPGTPEFVALDAIARGLLVHRTIRGIAGVVSAASGAYEAEKYNCGDPQT